MPSTEVSADFPRPSRRISRPWPLAAMNIEQKQAAGRSATTRPSGPAASSGTSAGAPRRVISAASTIRTSRVFPTSSRAGAQFCMNIFSKGRLRSLSLPVVLTVAVHEVWCGQSDRPSPRTLPPKLPKAATGRGYDHDSAGGDACRHSDDGSGGRRGRLTNSTATRHRQRRVRRLFPAETDAMQITARRPIRGLQAVIPRRQNNPRGKPGYMAITSSPWGMAHLLFRISPGRPQTR